MKLLLVYLLLINAAGFLLMLADKEKARNHCRRIPERALMLTAVVGGSFGCLLGMFLCHHKTKQFKFSIGLPLLFVLQSIGLLYAYMNI